MTIRCHFHSRNVGDPDLEGILGGHDRIRAAVAQASPVFLDKLKTIDKARKLIHEAASQRAELVVFPESWIAAYPYWTRASLGVDDSKKYGDVIATFQDNAIRIPSEDTDRLCDAARESKIHVAIGCNELSDLPGSRTIYNTLLFIDDEGRILGKHRKLMPTHEERLVWGMGDGSDLQIYPTKIGRLGGLICWENHMILARAALVMKGEELHAAVWPGSWYTTTRLIEADKEGKYCDAFPAIREHAFEAGAFVISAAPVIAKEEIPADFPYREQTDFDWACGGSAIVDPSGNFLVGPIFEKELILCADCEADSIKISKAFFDALGHYARFDVARLELREDRWVPFSKRKLASLKPNLVKLAEKYAIDPKKLEEIYKELIEGAEQD